MALVQGVFAYLILLFAISVHESAHAWSAEKLGDPTGKLQGRISLNPLDHIDPIGTILLPLLLLFAGWPVFGWAKPVAVNPFNLKNPRRDGLWISAAGPLSNIALAFLFILAFRFTRSMAPMHGSAFGIAEIFLLGAFINTILALFNLLPIPPLDGSGVLRGLLPTKMVGGYDRIRPYGMLILLGLIFLNGLDPLFRFAQRMVWYLLTL